MFDFPEVMDEINIGRTTSNGHDDSLALGTNMVLEEKVRISFNFIIY